MSLDEYGSWIELHIVLSIVLPEAIKKIQSLCIEHSTCLNLQGSSVMGSHQASMSPNRELSITTNLKGAQNIGNLHLRATAQGLSSSKSLQFLILKQG
jgi:hypothetical protein